MSWVCRDDCRREFGTTDEFVTHLRNDHGVLTTKGKKQMTLALDTARQAINSFEWEIEGRTYFETQVVDRPISLRYSPCVRRLETNE